MAARKQAMTKAAAQAARCARTQCPRPLSRNKLRSAMWLNRGASTSSALWNERGRKPGPGRTRCGIIDGLKRAEEFETQKETADKKTLATIRKLLRVFVPARKVKKAQRGR